MSPELLTNRLAAKWVRRYGVNSLSGNCGKLASILRDALLTHGFHGALHNGVYAGTNHCWIVVNGQILDPSIQQFNPNLSPIPSDTTPYLSRTACPF